VMLCVAEVAVKADGIATVLDQKVVSDTLRPSEMVAHGSRPSAMQYVATVIPITPHKLEYTGTTYTKGISSSALSKAIPMVVAAIAFVGIAFMLFQVPNLRLVEWESESVFMKFKDFQKFWTVASRLPASSRTKWIQQMCMMADAFSPIDIPEGEDEELTPDTPSQKREEDKKEETQIPENERVAPDIPDAVPGAVPVSLNGVVAPAAQTQKGEMLQGSLDKLMRLYQNSMQRMRTEKRSFLELSSTTTERKAPTPALEKSDDSGKLKSVVDRLVATAGTTTPEERNAAAFCWKRLKRKVLDERDLRRWRVLVKRGLMALGIFLLAMFTLSALNVADNITTNEGGIVQRTCLEPLHGTTCSTQGIFQMCRSPCPSDPNFSQFTICFHDLGDKYYWLPVTDCK